MTLEELYEDVISKMVEAVSEEGCHTQLVLVPSLGDVTHDDIYPQAPLATVEHEVGEEKKGV